MLLMGDEVRRTQRGNNNAYCQDDAVCWFDWDDVARAPGHPPFHPRADPIPPPGRRIFLARASGESRERQDHLARREGSASPTGATSSHTLAFELEDPDGGEHFLVMLNAYWEPLGVRAAAAAAGLAWRRVVDTALDEPADFSEPPSALIHQRQYRLDARSSVVLIAGLACSDDAREVEPHAGDHLEGDTPWPLTTT